ncbi:MAG: glyoxalase [Hyphomonadaceae bacterium BRH_c29]|jgi:lactoylglutathione lyase|nr:MAG: glyoxalase [Hyphomonadaceae bacterium BRH_c29]
MSIEFLHTMVRVTDIDATLKFFCDGLGLTEVGRYDSEPGRFTLVFLASPADIERCGGIPEGKSPTQMQIPMVELTHNWDPEDYTGGRNFGHLAYSVSDIYAAVEKLQALGVTINRPPRDGRMAFVRSPDGISVELLQQGKPLEPKEPWASAENIGSW